jgi:RHS repeat-associated protein
MNYAERPLWIYLLVLAMALLSAQTALAAGTGTGTRIVTDGGAEVSMESIQSVPQPRWRGPVRVKPEEQSSKHAVASKSMTAKNASVGTTETYYVYGNDGKLMAEYDADGVCIREYVYLGDTLVAEYRRQPDSTYRTYYYLGDQIRSTRVITDESGVPVYSAAHGPYGEELKTWIDTYDANLKFSGKEREEHTGQDYFGARYYDVKLYRFTSADPVMQREKVADEIRTLNLFSYVANDPINRFDADGRDWMRFTGRNLYYYDGEYGDRSKLLFRSPAVSGQPDYQCDPKSTKCPSPHGPLGERILRRW